MAPRHLAGTDSSKKNGSQEFSQSRPLRNFGRSKDHNEGAHRPHRSCSRLPSSLAMTMTMTMTMTGRMVRTAVHQDRPHPTRKGMFSGPACASAWCVPKALSGQCRRATMPGWRRKLWHPSKTWGRLPSLRAEDHPPRDRRPKCLTGSAITLVRLAQSFLFGAESARAARPRSRPPQPDGKSGLSVKETDQAKDSEWKRGMGL